jgi:mannose-1-phosphate guanylyltransferase
MRAMVLAAGLGTRLRPLTYEMPKPLVPVINRPIMDHILELVARHGFTDVVANLSYLPEQVRDRYGDGSEYGTTLEWSFEEELLGTAGGVRKVRDFFGDEPFLVMAADALTDVDLTALREAHDRHDGIATLAVKRIPDTREYGVVIAGSDGRVQGFQEKPDPAEALSDLANCMIYILRPEIFDYFPDRPFVDFALDVFPALLESDVPFHVHEVDSYWNDVGSLDEYLQGNLDALSGAVTLSPPRGESRDGVTVGEGTSLPEDGELWPPILLGNGCEIGAGVRLDGPIVIGDRCRIGSGSRLKHAVLLAGTEIPDSSVLAFGIAARHGGPAGRAAAGV